MKKIGRSAFNRCTALTIIDIPNSVTTICDCAFVECNSLTHVKLGDGVENIGLYAFAGCRALEFIDFPTSVSIIDDFSFQECSSLTVVTIPDAVTTIGAYAFYGCSGLMVVNLGNSVTEIGWAAFQDCGSMTSIIIPNSTVNIMGYALSGCTSLTDIYYAGTGEQWKAISKGVLCLNGVIATIHYSSTGPLDDWETPPACDANTTIAAPEGGWVEGENTFSVESANACVVLISNDGGETYTRLTATKNGEGYDFTATSVTSDTIIKAVRKGDLGGDGEISAEDISKIRNAQAGLTTLDGLENAIADLNGDGTVSLKEIAQIRLSAAGKYDIAW